MQWIQHSRNWHNGGAEVLDNKCLTSHPGCFTPKKESQYPLVCSDVSSFILTNEKESQGAKSGEAGGVGSHSP